MFNLKIGFWGNSVLDQGEVVVWKWSAYLGIQTSHLFGVLFSQTCTCFAWAYGVTVEKNLSCTMIEYKAVLKKKLF